MAAPYLNNQYINITPCQPKPGDAASWSQIDSRIKICPELHSKLHIYIYLYCSHPSIHPFPNSRKKHHLLWCFPTFTHALAQTDQRVLRFQSPHQIRHLTVQIINWSPTYPRLENFNTKKNVVFFRGIYLYKYICNTYVSIYIIYMYPMGIHGTGIFTYIWLKSMVVVGKDTTHGCYGYMYD